MPPGRAELQPGLGPPAARPGPGRPRRTPGQGRAASTRHTPPHNPQPAAFGIFPDLKPRLLLVSEGLLLQLGTARDTCALASKLTHMCKHSAVSQQRGRIKAPRLINARQFLSWTAWSCLSLLISWEEELA